jgi:hypothetical protein
MANTRLCLGVEVLGGKEHAELALDFAWRLRLRKRGAFEGG